MHHSRVVLAMVACTVLLTGGALAADVVIDDPRWLTLSDADRTALEQKLKAAGAIGQTDRIVYKGGKSTAVTEKNVGIAAAIPAVAAAICKGKNLWEMQTCARKPAGDRDACRSAEKARYAKAKSACQ